MSLAGSGCPIGAGALLCLEQQQLLGFPVEYRESKTEQTRLSKEQHLIQHLLLALSQRCLELEFSQPFPYLSKEPDPLAAA